MTTEFISTTNSLRPRHLLSYSAPVKAVLTYTAVCVCTTLAFGAAGPAANEAARAGLIEEARRLESEHKYTEAAGVYQRVLQQWPDQADNLAIQYRLVELHYDLGRETPDWETATTLLEDILARYDAHQYLVVMARVKLGELSLRRGGAWRERGLRELRQVAELAGDPLGESPDAERMHHMARYAARRLEADEATRRQLHNELTKGVDEMSQPGQWLDPATPAVGAALVLDGPSPDGTRLAHVEPQVPSASVGAPPALAVTNASTAHYAAVLGGAMFGVIVLMLVVRQLVRRSQARKEVE